MPEASEKTPYARCGAKTRKGTPCVMPPVTGRNRCRMHGGKSPRKHGLYAKGGPPPRLAEKIAAYAADPKLLDHKRIGAHLSALLDDLLAQIEGDEKATADQVESMVPVLRELQKTATNFQRIAIDKRFVDLVEAGPIFAQWVQGFLRYVPEDKHPQVLAELEELTRGGEPGATGSIH